MRQGDSYLKIHEESEAEYLENSGSLSLERRDYYFNRAITALKVAEERIQQYENGISWQTNCVNCAKLWDDNYNFYCEVERLKAEKEGRPWPAPMPKFDL